MRLAKERCRNAESIVRTGEGRHTPLLPGYDGDALFVPKIVMRQTGRGCCSAVALRLDTLKCSNDSDSQCCVEVPLNKQELGFGGLAAATLEAYVEGSVTCGKP